MTIEIHYNQHSPYIANHRLVQLVSEDFALLEAILTIIRPLCDYAEISEMYQNRHVLTFAFKEDV